MPICAPKATGGEFEAERAVRTKHVKETLIVCEASVT